MTEPVDLEAAAEGLAEMMEQEGCTVDREALADFIEELGPEGAEDLLSASDPGGLVDELEEMDLNLLEW